MILTTDVEKTLCTPGRASVLSFVVKKLLSQIPSICFSRDTNTHPSRYYSNIGPRQVMSNVIHESTRFYSSRLESRDSRHLTHATNLIDWREGSAEADGHGHWEQRNRGRAAHLRLRKHAPHSALLPSLPPSLPPRGPLTCLSQLI